MLSGLKNCWERKADDARVPKHFKTCTLTPDKTLVEEALVFRGSFPRVAMTKNLHREREIHSREPEYLALPTFTW